MHALLLASALSLLGPVKLTVNVKDGESIAGEKYFRVQVQSDNPVTKVEFYVAGEFRGDDTSTPYEFTLDALGEKEGEIEVKFKAFTSESEQGEVTLHLKVDNGLDKGVDFHAARGADDLTNAKYDEAITEGRIIMKIDSKSNTGRLLLARGNYGKGIFDKAQKFAEDAVAQDSQSVEGLEILAAINLQRAFKTTARSTGDSKDALATIKSALKAAADSRRKSLEIQLDKIGEPTDANLLQYADAAIRASRYSLAIKALEPAVRKDNRRTDITNRLAYAYIRSGRSVEALTTLEGLKKTGSFDAYSYALRAIVASDEGDAAGAQAAITEALVTDSQNLGVITAQAYIALQKNNNNALNKLATSLSKAGGQRYEAMYFLSALNNRLQNYPEGAKYFRAAVLAEPAASDVYIDYGAYSLGLALSKSVETKDKDAEFETARTYFETALVARPESAEALAGLTAIGLAQKNAPDAMKYGLAAVKAEPYAAVGHYALAAAYSAVAKVERNDAAAREALKGVQREMGLAEKLDKRNLSGRSTPNAEELFRYLKGGGRCPFISAPR